MLGLRPYPPLLVCLCGIEDRPTEAGRGRKLRPRRSGMGFYSGRAEPVT